VTCENTATAGALAGACSMNFPLRSSRDSAATLPESADDGSSGVNALFHATYERLRIMARRELNRAAESTVDTTGLVHELYLKISRGRDLEFSDRGKFFAYAGMAMRHILVDRARRRMALKVGGGETHVGLTDPGVDHVSVSAQRALQLDAALTALQADHSRAARVVELHFFAGLPLACVAELLGTVRRTIDRDWRYAKAFLLSHFD
jgi:RNA polymerase sigma factor (TIGR02999 family)